MTLGGCQLPSGFGAAVADPEALLDRLEVLARAGPRLATREDAAALDALAFDSARGGGAHEVAIGEGLDLLARTGGDVRLGFSCIGDLARERLGIGARQAQRLRRNAVALRARPLLRTAVLRGEVSARKAEVVIPVAAGAEEAYWVERARVDTVRRLEAAIRSPEHSDDDWHRIRIGLPPEQAEVVDTALDVAKVLVGPASPTWKRLWAIAAEYLSEHPVDPLEPMAARPAPSLPVGWSARMTGPEAAREPLPPAARLPEDQREPPAPRNPYEVVERLARLVAERAAADERLGRACLLVKSFGAARLLGYSCFEEYCVERLGLAPSTAYQRIALERRMRDLPELRAALRSRRLSYEQARLVARIATLGDVAARIEEAAGKTCIALARALEAEERLQMWDAGELRAVVPEDVGTLLADALRAARLHEGGLTPGEALVAVARHFILTWEAEVRRLARGADPVILRDGALCRVPGCSRAADHVHHVIPRSACGPLEPWNELSLCAVHHLRGVHGGSVRITGRAPDGLAFVLGEREVRAARA
jgi:hypothetical protein